VPEATPARRGWRQGEDTPSKKLRRVERSIKLSRYRKSTSSHKIRKVKRSINFLKIKIFFFLKRMRGRKRRMRLRSRREKISFLILILQPLNRCDLIVKSRMACRPLDK
jgi:hypothetical protein